MGRLNFDRYILFKFAFQQLNKIDYFQARYEKVDIYKSPYFGL